VPCSAAELEAGTYEGTIILTSNDPDYPMVEIPVTFYTGPTLIISEVADPSDNANARFVELYNSGNSVINLSSETWNISRQADGVAYADAALTGTIAPKGTYVISYSATSFNAAFGFDADQNAVSVVTGNGNDGYFLYKGGDHTSGTLIDIYGVIDEDGSGQPWEYTDSKAERKNTITTPSASWTASEWTITSAAVADMTPGEHNGNISWKGGTGNWNTAASWSNGSVPTSLDNVIVPDGATLTVDATDAAVHNIIIQEGGAFSIDATRALSVSGTITIEDGASFINNGILNNGAKGDATAIMQRTIDAYTTNANGWHLLSSPVNNFTIAGSDFEPGTATPNLDDFYAWGEVTYEWLNYKVGTNNITSFVNGQGYLVAYETTATKDFTGTFNNSDITFINLTKTTGKGEGWHLLGNPFQSALQWTNTGWAKANIAAGAKILNPGGTYTDITVGGTDIIPANQGFFIQVTNSTNSITIPKAGRTHNATAFYKNEIPNLLTLRASDGEFYVETWIQIMDDATDGFDEQYDVSFLGGVYQAPYLYSNISETEHFSTNRIAPVEDETIVQLAFKSFLNKEFTIKASNVGSFGDQLDVILEDTQEDVMIDLNKTPEYSFIASADELTVRFKVHLMKSTGIQETSPEDFNIYVFGKTIYLNSKNAGNAVVKVYNTTGQLVVSKQLNINGLTPVEVEFQTGWYVVKMLINENSFAKKIFVK
jgi:hypothetical protein